MWNQVTYIWYYSSRVLHAHYIHIIIHIHDLISHDLVFYHSRWYLTCQFILSSDLLFIHSCALLLLPLTFTFSYYYFLFSCVNLLVCFWRILIFQYQSLRRLTSHCSKEPKKITTVSLTFFWLMYFGIFPCYDVPMPKLYLLLFFLLCFKSNIQTKTIVDICLLCENETYGCLLHMCAWI